jgi:antitoxin CptB
MPALIDERALSKLRWRCRRGLLENDLFVQRFFERSAGRITEQQAAGMLALMDLADKIGRAHV